MHVIFCGFLFFDQSLCHAYHTGADISVDISLYIEKFFVILY